MKIRGILFDKDGTLLDYHASWMPLNREVALLAAAGDGELAEKLLVHGGYDPATGRVRTGTPLAAGTPDEIADCFAEFLHGRRRPDLTERIEQVFVEGGTSHAVPVPKVLETLTALRAQTSYLGIATHDSLGGIDTSLRPHGVLHLFDFFSGHDSGHGRKPGPGMVHAFCASTGLSPGEVCVVGDNLHDLHMGTSAGVALRIGVLTGTSVRDDLTGHADFVYDSIVEMHADPEFVRLLA